MELLPNGQGLGDGEAAALSRPQEEQQVSLIGEAGKEYRTYLPFIGNEKGQCSFLCAFQV